jgi:hypothetical protein
MLNNLMSLDYKWIWHACFLGRSGTHVLWAVIALTVNLEVLGSCAWHWSTCLMIVLSTCVSWALHALVILLNLSFTTIWLMNNLCGSVMNLLCNMLNNNWLNYLSNCLHNLLGNNYWLASLFPFAWTSLCWACLACTLLCHDLLL